MDYNNPYNFGDVVEVGEIYPKTYVIFGEMDQYFGEGVQYAAGDEATVGLAIKPNGLRLVGNDTKLADKYRKRFIVRSDKKGKYNNLLPLKA